MTNVRGAASRWHCPLREERDGDTRDGGGGGASVLLKYLIFFFKQKGTKAERKDLK